MWEFWRGKLGKTRRGEPRKTLATSTTAERRSLQVVNFKDLNLSVDDELESEESWDQGQGDEDPTNKVLIARHSNSLNRAIVQKNKLIIIMVGLPGRGKTFLCNKLKCYLNWLGHQTAHFNVGNYRRKQKGETERQDANFFDAKNQAGLVARHRALDAALNDLMGYLASPQGQVAIFDATNTTEERRRSLINTFHGKYQYMFIESICNDNEVLESNYRYKMKYSPDYQGVDTETALSDFLARIRKYEQVYEPVNDRRLHYIKLIDMVTGRGHMDVNRISGYIPGKIVFFLMQICKAGMAAGQSRKIWLTRHGESVYNTLGKIGGDSLLSPRGEDYARLLPDVLESRLPVQTNHEGGVAVSVWTSTLKRTIVTAHHLPYPKLRWKALDEIHAGAMDGMTYKEIEQRFPQDYLARNQDKLQYRYPAGESYLDVIQRLEPVIIEMEREREFICVVAHQAVLRAIFGYFTAMPPAKIPSLDIPLHTLIELQPRPDGTMEVTLLPVPLPQRAPSEAGPPNHHHPPRHSVGGQLAIPQDMLSRAIAGSHRRSASAGGGPPLPSPGPPSLSSLSSSHGASPLPFGLSSVIPSPPLWGAAGGGGAAAGSSWSSGGSGFGHARVPLEGGFGSVVSSPVGSMDIEGAAAASAAAAAALAAAAVSGGGAAAHSPAKVAVSGGGAAAHSLAKAAAAPQQQPQQQENFAFQPARPDSAEGKHQN